MMTKKQNIILNYAAVLVVLFSYLILKIYTDFHYIQVVQKISMFLILISGLVMVANNFIYLKKYNKKYVAVALMALGLILAFYSGFALYLIFALQNTGF